MNNQQITFARKMNKWATVISIVVVGLVAVMRKIPRLDLGVDFSFLPGLYSLLNAISAICLIAALLAIRQKNVVVHRRWIFAALSLSTLFLLMYVLYHITTPETKYCGSMGYVYFPLLITHIISAAVSFPFILFTFIRGYTTQIEKHKKMAKWVYWLWLYVAITGPACYMMLLPCYQ